MRGGIWPGLLQCKGGRAGISDHRVRVMGEFPSGLGVDVTNGRERVVRACWEFKEQTSAAQGWELRDSIILSGP